MAPDRLRFEFTHFKAVDSGQLERIEELVNDYIRRNAPLKVDLMDLEKAEKSGATALFGEKYDKQVRVITVGDISKELCGGPHVSHSAEIGKFKITKEEAVSAGVRRIRATID